MIRWAVALVSALIVAAALLVPRPAEAKQMDAETTCMNLAVFAKSLMEARQNGLPVADLMAASKDPEFHAMVVSVYVLPRGRTLAEREAVTKRFTLGVYAECLVDFAASAP
jgi:hypothetical protein